MAASVGLPGSRAADEVGVELLGRPRRGGARGRCGAAVVRRVGRAAAGCAAARPGRRPSATRRRSRSAGRSARSTLSAGINERNSSDQRVAARRRPPARAAAARCRPARPPARAGARPTSLRHLQGLVGAAVVDRPLHARVVELGRRAHPGPLDVDVGALAGLVDVDRPEQGGPHLVGQQRRRPLGQHRRVERDLGVRAVERLAALRGPRRRRGRPARRRPRRRRSRSGRRSRCPRAAMCSAWSRSFEPGGSMVTNGRSVRSRSGSRGDRRPRGARPPPPRARTPARTFSSRLDRGDPVRAGTPRRHLVTGVDPDHSTRGHDAHPSDPAVARRVLILLPPSEGKAIPRRGGRCDLETWPAGLRRATRAGARRAPVDCAERTRRPLPRRSGSGRPSWTTYGATPDCGPLPTAAAERIYSGVLYDALGLASLDASAHRRALAAGGRHLLALRAGAARRADRAVPARWRRHPARPRRGRRPLARRARPGGP